MLVLALPSVWRREKRREAHRSFLGPEGKEDGEDEEEEEEWIRSREVKGEQVAGCAMVEEDGKRREGEKDERSPKREAVDERKRDRKKKGRAEGTKGRGRS